MPEQATTDESQQPEPEADLDAVIEALWRSSTLRSQRAWPNIAIGGRSYCVPAQKK